MAQIIWYRFLAHFAMLSQLLCSDLLPALPFITMDLREIISSLVIISNLSASRKNCLENRAHHLKGQFTKVPFIWRKLENWKLFKWMDPLSWNSVSICFLHFVWLILVFDKNVFTQCPCSKRIISFTCIMTTKTTKRTMSLLRLEFESLSFCCRDIWSRVSWTLPRRSSMDRVWSRRGPSDASRRRDTAASTSSALFERLGKNKNVLVPLEKYRNL